MHIERQRCIKVFVEKPERKVQLRRPGHGWEEN
jgi:hypothetical protein